jgi:hypothetical protein
MATRTRKGKRRNRKAGSRDARGRIRGKEEKQIKQTEQNRNTRCANRDLHSRCLKDHIPWLTGNNKRRRIRTSNKERELSSPQNVQTRDSLE